MPTLQEWKKALLLKRRVKVISDDKLIQAVQTRKEKSSHTGSMKEAIIAPQVSPHKYASIMPLEILGAMGLITTPRIDNLVDLCSGWAKIRYIWAFNPSPARNYYSRQLRLSEEALHIDFHQKALLSDEIGMGMAALVMDKFFDAYNPVDVSLVLRDGSIPGLTKVEDASPDFIFQSRIDNSYLVVECKGTRSGYTNAVKQLQRGTEQVLSLRFPTQDIPSYVVSTEISDEHTYVYVVDPPSAIQGGSSNNDIILIPNQQRFQEALQQQQAANLFLYTGAFTRAQELMPPKKYVQDRMSLSSSMDPPIEEYDRKLRTTLLGVRQSFSFPGEYGSVSIFQGISSQLYRPLALANYDEVADGLGSWIERISVASRKRTSPIDAHYSFQSSEESLSATLYQKDGTILKIDVTK